LATLTIVTNDVAGPASVQLTGAGTQSPPTTPSSSPSPNKPGAVQLLSCRTVKAGAHPRCTRRRLSPSATFVVAATATRGSLSRSGTVYATGMSNHGQLVLRARRAVAAGTYTLTLAQGGHRTTTRVVVR
jgi:hypothetical protein